MNKLISLAVIVFPSGLFFMLVACGGTPEPVDLLPPQQPWEGARLLGTTGVDVATAVAVDAAGRVYLTGRTGGDLGGGDPWSGKEAIFLARYDADGNREWVVQIGASALDIGNSVAVDGSGNIYVAGSTSSALLGQPWGGGQDAFVVSYTPAGDLRWVTQLGTSAADIANAIAVDANGVYVTGMTAGELSEIEDQQGGQDVFVARFDLTSGDRVWLRQFGTVGNDIGNAVALDGSGHVFVAGSTRGNFQGTAAVNQDAFVAKFEPLSGDLVGSIRQFGTVGFDAANGVAIGANGEVYVTGSVKGALPGQTLGGTEDLYLAKFGANLTGTPIFQQVSAGPGSSARGNAIAAYRNGDIYVAGSIFGNLPGQSTSGNYDVFLIKFHSGAGAQWHRQFGSNSIDESFGVAVGPGGNIFVTGSTNGDLDGNANAGNADAFVTKFDPAGNRQ